MTCALVYFFSFTLLERKSKKIFSGLKISELLLLIVCLISVACYSFNYKQASRSADALILIFGITAGRLFSCWRCNAKEPCIIGYPILKVLIVLLAVGACWQPEINGTFQYRGEYRRSGPWDNPNTFGELMGVGVVMAVGMIVQGIRLKVQSSERHLTPALSKNEAEREMNARNIEHPTLNTEHRIGASQTWRWMKVVLFLAAAGVMLFGLVKSHSRGAWVGALIASSYLIYQVFRFPDFQIVKPVQGVGKKWIPLALVLLSIGVMVFWNFRHTNHSTVRRAFSVGNANDFSWRKRLAAYEGALQMIADKPWFGLGWNQPEPVYDGFYRSPNVDEGMAIQVNDYFTLGTTLGIPALGCFLAYIWLSLTRNAERGTRKGKQEHRTSNKEHRTSNEEWGAHAPRVLCSASSRSTSTSHPQTEKRENEAVGEPPTEAGGTPTLPVNEEERLLRITCRAGAIVLLVGFFFDGGLFKLATGATFWILLELGAERGAVQGPTSDVQSETSAVVPA